MNWRGLKPPVTDSMIVPKLPVALFLAQTVALAATPQNLDSLAVLQLAYQSQYSDRDDARLAKEFSRMNLAEQLDPHVVYFLRTLGIGPQSMGALEQLRKRTSFLPVLPGARVAVQPLPAESERKAMLEKTYGYAQSYVGTLPNFICDQITKRYTNFDRGAQMEAKFAKHLYLSDTVKWSLRFVNGTEEGNLLNKRKGGRGHSVVKTGQTLSRGEFGSDLLLIFSPGANAHLRWDHWEISGTTRTAVWSYKVELPGSRFQIVWSSDDASDPTDDNTIRAAINGLIWTNPESGSVSRLTIEAVGLPKDLPIQESRTAIEYGPIKIADRIHILPVSASVFVRAERLRTWNDIAFVNYRKFEAESTLTFTDPKIQYGGQTKR
jgi:hypothetical protein